MEQIILNLVPGGVSPVCYVSQYDVGRKIRLHLRNGSDPYVLSGAETVTATIRKVSGEELIYDIANTSASYVDLIVNYDATDVIGESVCELIITESGTRLGSANFKMRVDPDVYSGDEKLEVVTASSPNSLLSFETNIDENLLELNADLSPVQEGTPWIDSNEINKEPYIKRAVAGTATRIGNHLYDKLVGGTVAFNQKVATYSNNASTVVDNQDGTLTVTSNAQVYYFGITLEATGHAVLKTTIDHKYFFYTKILSSNIENFNNFGVGNWTDGPQNSSQLTGKFAKIIRSKNDTVGTYFNVTTAGTSLSTDTFTCTKPILIDLTQMFGSTIADYIYGLEQATAGAGVAFFRNLFPNDYYAYNAGELMSVKATAHIMRDASNNVIGNYALDSNLELRGIPKLVNNKLEYDGDEYSSDGNVVRKYGVVDLGSLNWILSPEGFFNAPLAGVRYATSGAIIPNLKSIPYVTDTPSHVYVGTNDKTISTGTGGANVWVRDSAYDNADTFKTAMSGVYLVYELATPTTEQASPFTNPQVCDENGTEEYTDSRAVAIPVGHETYQANICPINGYSSANITRCGVNLWDEEWERGVYNANGSKSSSMSYICSKNKINVLPNTTYYIVRPDFTIYICKYDKNGNFIERIEIYSVQQTFTTDSDTYSIHFCIGSQATPITEYNNDISLNYPATDMEYHPYNGNTYTIAFGQTVYGGVLDVTRGKLTVTYVGIDMGTLNWIYPASDELFYSDISDIKPNPSWGAISTVKCPIFVTTNPNMIANKQGDYEIAVWPTGHRIVVRDTDYSNASTFTTAMNGIIMVYELATPFDIDITPVQISALVGENNVLSDTNGGMEIKYFRLVPRQ